MKTKLLPILLVVALLIAALSITAMATDTPVAPNDVSKYAKENMSPLFVDTDHVYTWCPVCNKEVHWYALETPKTDSYALDPTWHWFLKKDITHTGGGYFYVASEKSICLYLNGKTLSNASYIAAQARGTLNLIGDDTGTVSGGGLNAAAYGGAIDVRGGTLNLFGGNYTKTAGTTRVGPTIACSETAGTINVYNGTTISGGANAGNVGGNIGLFGEGSTLNIYGGTISGGQASNGGNIAATASNCTVSLIGGTISGGTATNWGGNFYGEGGGKLVVTGGTIETGNGKYGGNVAINNAYLTLSAGTIKNGTATERGGNLYLSQWVGSSIGGATITGGSLEGGNAVHGGSVFMESGSKVTMTGLTVTGGTASKLGGGFHVSNAQLTLNNCSVSGGSASTWGGNIYADTSSAKVTITGTTTVSGGTAPSGGSIAIHDKATLEIQSGEISGGTAPNFGGNIFMSNGTFTQTGGTVKNGTSNTDRGGNLYVSGSATANISNATYEGGNAGYHGGSIFSEGGLTMADTTVTGGTSTKYGGNLAVAGGSLEMTNCQLTNGTASGVGGNIYTYKDATSVRIIDSKIIGGNAPTGGNGYYSAGMYAQNSIFEAPASASGSGSQFYNDAALIFDGCTLTNGTVMGDGNITLTDSTAQLNNLQMREDTLTLSGTTTANKITFNEPAGMYVKSDFTGNVVFASMVGAPEAPIYGKLLGSKFTAEGDFTGVITCAFDVEEPWACNKDGGLMAGSCRTVKNGEVTWFADNDKAIAGYNGADYLWPVIDGTMALNGDYTVDLFGTNQTITGTGNVTLFDSANADYKTYGSATLNGPNLANGFATSVQGNTYYKLGTGNTYTFHRLGVKVNGVSLRPDAAGIYYSSNWACDEALQALVKNFGVAVSLANQPGSDFATDSDTIYTQFQSSEFVSGETKTSVLIKDIFKTDAQDNAQRGIKPIYATAYIVLQTAEGDVVVTDKANYKHSMHDVLSIVDSKIGDYSAHAQDLQNFMTKWSQYGVTGEDWDFSFSVAPEIVQLNALYAGKTAYQGEMHDHADTGGRSDGKQTLATWVKGMKKLKMDFATILDHDQSRHMYLDEWDDAVFIGGTETTGWLTNGIKVTKGEFHMNLIFADVKNFEAFIQEYADKFKPYVDEETGGLIFDASYTYLPETKEYLTELIHAVQKHGGFYVIPHNKQSMQSEDPLDYYFADWTGIEVQYTYYSTRDGEKSQANYKLWTDLLALGKKLYCTAGNDEHDMPTVKALTTIYSPENTPAVLVEQMREGNFNPGPIGIRMAIGDILMGKEGDFTGKKLAFVVGDIHESELKEDHTYRVDLFCGSEVVKSFYMSNPGENFYQVVDIDENADFYRLEVIDETANSRVALSQPIWNTK